MTNKKQALVVVVTVILAGGGLLVVPWQNIYLASQPQVEMKTAFVNVIDVATRNFTEVVTMEVTTIVYGSPSISDASQLTVNVTVLIPSGFVSQENLGEITFVPELGFKPNISEKYLQPATILLTGASNSSEWSKLGNMVYFTSGTYNATLTFLSRNGSIISEKPFPMDLQVSGEDVTYSVIGVEVGTALTLVIVAFLVFEFYEKLGNDGKDDDEYYDQE